MKAKALAILAILAIAGTPAMTACGPGEERIRNDSEEFLQIYKEAKRPEELAQMKNCVLEEIEYLHSSEKSQEEKTREAQAECVFHARRIVRNREIEEQIRRDRAFAEKKLDEYEARVPQRLQEQ